MAPFRSPHTAKRSFTEIKFNTQALLDRARNAIWKSNRIIEQTERLIKGSNELRGTEEEKFAVIFSDV